MPKSTFHRVVARLILGLLVLLELPLGAIAFYWLLTLPDAAVLATSNPASTALMEARKLAAREQGRPFKRLWTWVPLKEISPHLQRAVILAEDDSFYSHRGFDWEGIKEAALRNWRRGELRRGGSTITQQLAKNLYLSSDKSLLRAEAAARHRFGKSAAELTLEEAATLAAILPSPRRYDPVRITPYLSKRREQIMKRLQEKFEPDATEGKRAGK